MKNAYLATAKFLIAAGITLVSLTPALAQHHPAALLRDARIPASPLQAALTHARPLSLDLADARAVLATAPPESQPGTAPLVLSLPLPDGRSARFALRETAVMAPALAARYPDIKTYAGRGLDDATATLRLDLTPHGLHAQVLSAATGTVYIDPAQRGDTRHYLSFFARDARPEAWPSVACHEPLTGVKAGAGPSAPAAAAPAGGGGPAALGSGGVVRTYRLAVAATGEYTQFHGGTVPLGLAAIVTSVNRISGVFETELAVRFMLVANNDRLVFTNPATDPYTDGNTVLMVAENQTTTDNLIGSANYDSGHVFGGRNGGGLGYLRSVCQAGAKANGATCLTDPIGDFFSVKYVCHEMGHQFGAGHIFNSNNLPSCGGNHSPLTAWEPGSGTSLMSYSGLCGSDNLQSFSDAFFNVGNYEQMRNFIGGTSCATVAATGNTPPVVSIPAGGLTLPINTPFKLTASGLDLENDALTYSWEEQDLGTPAALTDPQVANVNRPLFRSLPPGTSSTRYFPALGRIVTGTFDLAEQLPLVTRQLTFKCTARDLHAGPAGVVGGITSSDSLKLRVTSAAGPFRVTAPNTSLTWTGGSSRTVTWAVAGTTANGVNCARVNIRLSTDGGYTYPTILALSVPNNGTAAVTIPTVNTSQARIMVEAADNYFFDISDNDFTISSPAPCAPVAGLTVNTITNTSARVQFTPSPGATQYVVTTTPASTSQTVSAAPVTLTGLTPGTAYTVQVQSSCGSGSSVAATTSFTTTAPPLCLTPSEVTVSDRTTTSATVNFVGVAGATSYTVRTVPATTTQTLTASPALLTGLLPGTSYTVYVTSTCAAGAVSAPTAVAFRTLYPTPANDLCANALPLTCGVRVTGNTENSTATGDPTAFCDVSVDGGGVFYALRTAGGAVNITMCDAVTTYDSKLFVYQGPCGGPYTCVVGNDDTRANGCSQPASVNFNAVAGATYLVFVSGYGSETGSFALLATCAPLATAPAASPAFTVAPNPVGAGTALRVTLAAPAAAATLTLHNMLGQRLARQSFAGRHGELDTQALAAGTYLLTVQVAGQAPVVRRVVVE
ncbi:zinc-dependent metalloprotease family protein [Hymenobacter sp. ASUV-10]|uniref:Zinc-dependent metalloprotease family protein n=1 Tax=Hymenobacter aranciens TaxID=3063996 RepID=A0ABT9B9J7_9BACT|nr:zinc-dependent metalloprotease family protein [Hymenobacter sp. ASUV-10]MDO7873223.1 zinc-dependent metalloprotease family protein [Hymenobacter sp. ASUV-10]